MKKLLLLLILIAFNYAGRASHIAGAYITYQFTGNTNEFLVKLTLYRDCSGIPFPQTETVCFSSTSCGILAHYTEVLQLVSSSEINICANVITGVTTCQGGASYGIEKYEYSAVITLPNPCFDWRIDYTFIQEPGLFGSSPVYANVHSIINNYFFPQNSSPSVHNDPCFIGCVQLNNCFSLNVTDTNNNGFYFQKVPVDTASGILCPLYITGQHTSFLHNVLNLDSLTGMECINYPLQSVGYYGIKITENLNGNFLPYIQAFFIYNLVANCPLSVNETGNRASFNCTYSHDLLVITGIVSQTMNINFELINSLGQKKQTLFSGKLPSGKKELSFSLKEFPAGIYFVKMNIDGKEEVKKLVKL